MIFLYRLLTTTLFPVLVLIIYLRKFFGKEDKSRFKEKFLIRDDYQDFQWKAKNVIWFHAASVGEVNSIIPIIKEILENKTDVFILLTSTSLSSSQLIKKKIDLKNFKHHFFVLDISFLVKKFINYWNPKLVIFVDSEVWPSHLLEIKKRKIPLILLNGRITNKTLKRWQLFKKTSQDIFSLYDLCLASSEESLNNLKNLGAKSVEYIGNIKFCADVKNKNKYDNNQSIYGNKKIWSAASTHPGEEIFFFKTHIELKNKGENILTIIIPRHTNRSKEILAIGKSLKLKVEILNDVDEIKEDSEVIVVNSIGNMTNFFNKSRSVFMGKSLLKKLIEVGGQNPIEPAKCGCKIYHGPFVSNFKEIYNLLNNKKIAFEVNNETNLAKNLSRDFNQKKMTDNNNLNELNLYGKKILLDTVNKILKLQK